MLGGPPRPLSPSFVPKVLWTVVLMNTLALYYIGFCCLSRNIRDPSIQGTKY